MAFDVFYPFHPLADDRPLCLRRAARAAGMAPSDIGDIVLLLGLCSLRYLRAGRGDHSDNLGPVTRARLRVGFVALFSS